MKHSGKTTKQLQFQKLIKGISKGRKHAFEKFFNAYGKFIFMTAKTVCKKSDLAEEVVDDVLIKVWKLADHLIDLENPDGWLYVVTINCAKDKLKREWLPLSENYPDQKDYLDDLLGKDGFYALIKELSETEQKILILKFIQDLTFKEIAETLERPISSVSDIYYRALTKVEKQIKGQNIS